MGTSKVIISIRAPLSPPLFIVRSRTAQTVLRSQPLGAQRTGAPGRKLPTPSHTAPSIALIAEALGLPQQSSGDAWLSALAGEQREAASPKPACPRPLPPLTPPATH